MRLALYQCNSPAGDLSAGLTVLDKVAGQAAGQFVDMLVLPELFLPGYDAAVAGAEGPDGLDAVAKIAAQHGIGLTIGSVETDGSARYNCATAFGADGAQLASYSKIQLFGEREAGAFVPGEDYVVFDYRGRRFGLLICYDVEFPEHVRALKRLGAEILLVPTANMMPFVNVNQIMVPARAMENALTIVYANYCGTEGDLIYTGLSGIFGPDGYPMASKGINPGMIIADVSVQTDEHVIPLSTQIADLRGPF